MDSLALSVTPEGQITVSLNGNVVCQGSPNVWNMIPDKTMARQINQNECQIVQMCDALGASARFMFQLRGQDLIVVAEILNAGTVAISNPQFNLPAFSWPTQPTGTMQRWHWTYLQAQGASTFWPSYQCPIGCVTAGDPSYAISVFSPSEVQAQKQHLIQSSFNNNILANPMTLEFHTTELILPGGSCAFSMQIRITTDQSMPGLLSGYKAYVPKVRYASESRPMVQFASIDNTWVTPTDPYGYNGDNRRIDTPLGVQNYLAMVLPILKATNALGVLFWAPGGVWAPSMYPVDYDVNLQRISGTWPTLVKALKAEGFRVGIAARMGEKYDATGNIVRADPTSMADISLLLQRLDYCKNTGIDMWYIDSAGGDVQSVAMIKHARDHLGPNHLFFSEYTSESCAVQSGQYLEYMGPGGTRWMGDNVRQQLNYLFDNTINNVCVDRSGTMTLQSLAAIGLCQLIGD